MRLTQSLTCTSLSLFLPSFLSLLLSLPLSLSLSFFPSLLLSFSPSLLLSFSPSLPPPPPPSLPSPLQITMVARFVPTSLVRHYNMEIKRASISISPALGNATRSTSRSSILSGVSSNFSNAPYPSRVVPQSAQYERILCTILFIDSESAPARVVLSRLCLCLPPSSPSLLPLFCPFHLWLLTIL